MSLLLTGVGRPSGIGSSPPPSYTGLGDIVPGALAFYGLRGYNAAYVSKAVNVVRASDSTARDINILAGGHLDMATLISFLSGTTGKVAAWYDQSGNGNDVVQATDANRPALTLNGINTSLPVLTFAGGQALIGPSITHAQPFTFSSVYNRTASSPGAILAGFHNGPVLDTNVGANLADVYDNVSASINAAAADGAWHEVNAVINSASSLIDVDGTITTGSLSGSAAASDAITIGWNSDTTLQFTGGLAQFAIYESVIDNTHLGLFHANDAAWYGTP